LKFLLDNNLPPALARALSELTKSREPGVAEVVALRDKFAANTKDEVWITALVHEGGWNIVSGDNLKKTLVERQLVRQAGVNVFVLQKAWSSQQYWQKSAQLVLWWPKIIDYASKSQKIAVRIPWRVNGKFEQI
jgi:predicted nuclease of predicted toxin-antitoxin system